jgi:hypothetical protein
VVNGSSRQTSNQTEPTPPVVIKVSPMAHFAVGFFALGLLIPVLTRPPAAPLLVIPAMLSVLIIRLRTLADKHGITVRTLLGSQTVRWDEIDGLRFSRSSWARAQLKSGTELRLPAVTFATLPLLTEVSGGRVPNPYRSPGDDPDLGRGDPAGRSSYGVSAVEEHPQSDSAADAP